MEEIAFLVVEDKMNYFPKNAVNIHRGKTLDWAEPWPKYSFRPPKSKFRGRYSPFGWVGQASELMEKGISSLPAPGSGQKVPLSG